MSGYRFLKVEAELVPRTEDTIIPRNSAVERIPTRLRTTYGEHAATLCLLKKICCGELLSQAPPVIVVKNIPSLPYMQCGRAPSWMKSGIGVVGLPSKS